MSSANQHSRSARSSLTKLPSEVLLNICTFLTTPSFLLLASTCRTLFHLPTSSRDLLLKHLTDVPGITLGLDDGTVSNEHLWLLLRQRASAHLYGANFNADCSSYALQAGLLNPSASCLGHSYGDVGISLACYDSAESREFNSRCSPLDKLPSPYRDGLGRIVQVVHHGNFISVLYAWQAVKDPAETSPPASPTLGPRLPPVRPTRIPERPSVFLRECRERSQSPPGGEEAKTRYHLVHYDSHGFEPPTFFTIKPPKPVKHAAAGNGRNLVLHPIHIAIHNRLTCAITWRESRLGRLSTTVIMLYVTDKLPPFFEQGTYASFKVYPPRPPPPPPPPPAPAANPTSLVGAIAAESQEDSRRSWRKDMAYFSRYRPVATAFWHRGDRLAIYSCARHIPIAAVVVDQVRLNDVLNVRLARLDRFFPMMGLHFRLDRPFYGKHLLSSIHHENMPGTFCMQVHLRLAELLDTHPDKETGVEGQIAMCIYLTRFALRSVECPHYFDLDSASDFAERSPGYRLLSQHAVARLWGWEPPSHNPSTMSALDTVAISPGGTRIAISYWNRVLVWALEPDVLVEDEWDEYSPGNSEASDSGSEDAGHDLDVETNNNNNNNNNNNSHGSDDNPAAAAAAAAAADADSDADSAAEPGGHAQHEEHADDSGTAAHSGPPSVASLHLKSRKDAAERAAGFYNMTRDRRLGHIVELRPIVLHLLNGEVARKMRWRSQSPQESDSDDDDDDKQESEAGSSWSERLASSDSDSEAVPPVAPTAPPSEVYSPTAAANPTGGRLFRRARGRRRGSRRYSPIMRPSHDADVDSEQDTQPSDQDEPQDGKPTVRHGVSKPSEAWRMNKTIDLVGDEGEDEDEDDNTDGDDKHLHHHHRRLPAEELRRRRRCIKGKLAIRDPPGDRVRAGEAILTDRTAAAAASTASVHNTNETNDDDDDDDDDDRNDNDDYDNDDDNDNDTQAAGSGSDNEGRSTRRKMKQKKRKKRQTEDELVVLTDRGVQVWNMGVWAAGRREDAVIADF